MIMNNPFFKYNTKNDQRHAAAFRRKLKDLSTRAYMNVAFNPKTGPILGTAYVEKIDFAFQL